MMSSVKVNKMIINPISPRIYNKTIFSIKLTTQQDVQEISVRYDGEGSDLSDCKIMSPGEGRSCTLTLTAKEAMKAPVYVYYQLSNYYQNHRNYVTSLNIAQLMGCTHKSQDGCASYERAAMKQSCGPLLH